jgi:hypothetical protein
MTQTQSEDQHSQIAGSARDYLRTVTIVDETEAHGPPVHVGSVILLDGEYVPGLINTALGWWVEGSSADGTRVTFHARTSDIGGLSVRGIPVLTPADAPWETLGEWTKVHAFVARVEIVDASGEYADLAEQVKAENRKAWAEARQGPAS